MFFKVFNLKFHAFLQEIQNSKAFQYLRPVHPVVCYFTVSLDVLKLFFWYHIVLEKNGSI